MTTLDYTVEELKQFADGISLSLCSLKSSQHWNYRKETADKIMWLEHLYGKVKDDIHRKESGICQHWRR